MTNPPLSGIDLAADAQAAQASPDSPALKSVADQVREWGLAKRRIADLAQELGRLSAVVTEIEQVRLPAAMAEAGVQSFTTPDGRSVKIEVVARGNIPAMTSIEKAKGAEKAALVARRNTAIEYVRTHWSGLIKTELSLSLGKGEAEVALRIAEMIRNQFQLSPTVDETIHPATLNSHFNELREMGTLKDVPTEPFAMYVGPIAKIK